MTSERFTQNESAVILSLMRNPEHSDTEISRAMEMNLFTFNKIKNSLIRKRMLTKQYVPNYGRLGHEILVVGNGTGIDSYGCEGEIDNVGRILGSEMPKMSIFGLLEGNNGIIFHVIRDFTELKRVLRIKDNLEKSLPVPARSFKNYLFSFRDLSIERFFDVQDLLEEGIGGRVVPILDPETPAQRASSMKWSEFFDLGKEDPDRSLQEDEMKVLIELVRSPETKETDMIKKLDMSRYRLNKIRDSLMEEGYIKPFYSTNVVGMGYEVLIFTHMKFRPGQDPSRLFRIYEERMPSNLMIVAFDHTEVVGLGIFRNLTEGSRAQMNMRKAMVDYDFLEGEPEIKIFSLPNCREGPPLSFHSPLIRTGDMMESLR
jgi:hypothetical protein